MIYVIYSMDDVSSIDFLSIAETNQESLRLSVDGTKTVLKFQGETPSFLEGLTQYTNSQILIIMRTPEWTKIE